MRAGAACVLQADWGCSALPAKRYWGFRVCDRSKLREDLCYIHPDSAQPHSSVAWVGHLPVLNWFEDFDAICEGSCPAHDRMPLVE